MRDDDLPVAIAGAEPAIGVINCNRCSMPLTWRPDDDRHQCTSCGAYVTAEHVENLASYGVRITAVAPTVTAANDGADDGAPKP